MSTFYGKNDYRNYLMHYGVPGMRWRRHKYTGSGSEGFNYVEKTGASGARPSTFGRRRVGERIAQYDNAIYRNYSGSPQRWFRAGLGLNDKRGVNIRYRDDNGKLNAVNDNRRARANGTTAGQEAARRIGIEPRKTSNDTPNKSGSTNSSINRRNGESNARTMREVNSTNSKNRTARQQAQDRFERRVKRNENAGVNRRDAILQGLRSEMPKTDPSQAKSNKNEAVNRVITRGEKYSESGLNRRQSILAALRDEKNRNQRRRRG